MSRLYINCKCGSKFDTEAFYRFFCPHCGVIYVQVRIGEDSYTWEIEDDR